ncbi:hypothetical protein MNBD_GAMMA25-1354 [hydrothermal vent metagenome]|uniref:Death on curing protein, Doc toxin n=1 Tax=hydrothermal vent metagenome TaxID=652676 RepID=A0A3B1BEV9_9ZZZZ
MKILYSPEAVNDLIQLRKFIEVKNPSAAQRIALAIKKGINQLKTFSYLGVEVAQAPNPEMIRDLIIGKYIIRYLIRSNDIYILRVWHHKENRL